VRGRRRSKGCGRAPAAPPAARSRPSVPTPPRLCSGQLDGQFARSTLEWLLENGTPTAGSQGAASAGARAASAATASGRLPRAQQPSPYARPAKRRRSDPAGRRARGAAGERGDARARAATGPRPNLPDAMRLLDSLPCLERALLVEAARLCAPASAGGGGVARGPASAVAPHRAAPPAARPPRVPSAVARTPAALLPHHAGALSDVSPLDLGALLGGACTPPGWHGAHAGAEVTLLPTPGGGRASGSGGARGARASADRGGADALFKGLSADYSSAVSHAATDDVLRLGLGA